MQKYSVEQNIYFVLRIAIAMCFIGHGAFGIITKPIWANYFAVFGIGHDTAFMLMPWVGVFDIALGLSMLIYPTRAVALWLVFWGLFTASLRPLSGEPFAELIERAGNFGAPLCFLLITGKSTSITGWFSRIKPNLDINTVKWPQLLLALRAMVFLLLAGHGWLNLLHKQGLINQYISLGFTDANQVSVIVGLAEICAAVMVLIHPSRAILLTLFIWKMATELFYPHYELFEWIERGGSYACILSLLIALQPGYRTKSSLTDVYSLIKYKLNLKQL